ncbi:jg2291 [Pararge aegeria aegeria]|uniref:Jg2291 protein n=1 Tax=Pararge aegeria aegeria TaxID=348720 RepID=A0A8S4QU79_9NEOP|nr:jg2291 [Pararge aegeria aegeria]
MSNQGHERRSRSRYRASLSGHGTARSGDSDSGRRRRSSHSRLTSKRHNSPNKVLIEQMQQLQNRLIALEGQRRSSPPRLHEPNADCLPALSPPRLRPVTATVAEQQRSVVEGRESAMPSSPGRPVSAMTDRDASGTDRIIEAIGSINTTVRSNQSYYISNFDPSIHDIDIWCEEVERAKSTNYWNDNECLSRIGNCLKGDARTWLNEWVSNDRSWSNFKKKFKPLCPRIPGIASILYRGHEY